MQFVERQSLTGKIGQDRRAGKRSASRLSHHFAPAAEHHLPSIQGDKYHFECNTLSLTKAIRNPRHVTVLYRLVVDNLHNVHGHPRRGWGVPKSVAAERFVLMAGCVALSRYGSLLVRRCWQGYNEAWGTMNAAV